MKETEIYAVVFSNYEPEESAAIYDNREAAQLHADYLNEFTKGWKVQPWTLRSEFTRE